MVRTRQASSMVAHLGLYHCGGDYHVLWLCVLHQPLSHRPRRCVWRWYCFAQPLPQHPSRHLRLVLRCAAAHTLCHIPRLQNRVTHHLCRADDPTRDELARLDSLSQSRCHQGTRSYSALWRSDQHERTSHAHHHHRSCHHRIGLRSGSAPTSHHRRHGHRGDVFAEISQHPLLQWHPHLRCNGGALRTLGLRTRTRTRGCWRKWTVMASLFLFAHCHLCCG